MNKYIVTFGTVVDSVEVYAKNIDEAKRNAWDEYDRARELETESDNDEIIIKSVKQTN